MNPFEQLIAQLDALDIKVNARGDKLELSAPKGALTPQLKQELALFKNELLDHCHRQQEIVNISPRPPGCTIPLSFAQHRLWFTEQMGISGSAYHVPVRLRIRGPLEVGALANAFAAVIERHEALRTVFIERDQGPEQVILETYSPQLPLLDLSQLKVGDRENEVQRISDLVAGRPFDLSSDLMLRSVLLRFSTREHLLLLTFHHIAFDGWSGGVFLRDLGGAYDFYTRKIPMGPAPSVQYADFSVWQHRYLDNRELNRLIQWWRQRIEGIPPLTLNPDKTRPLVQTFAGLNCPFEVEALVYHRIMNSGGQEKNTLFIKLLAAFQMFMGRYSGLDRFVLGSPTANRGRSQIQDLVGFFVNSLVFPADLSDDPSYAAFLKRTHESVTACYDHQELPFEKLVEALQPERDLSQTPLFQIVFALQPPAGGQIPLGNLHTDVLASASITVRFDLEMHLWQDGNRLFGSAVYNSDLFLPETLQRLVEHWLRFLDSVTCHPELRLSRLEFLTREDRQKILLDWNQTRREIDLPALHHLVLGRENMELPAMDMAGNSWSYGQLVCLANRFSNYLDLKAYAPETPIALCLYRCPEALCLMLGILGAGLAWVPLDPDDGDRRLFTMITDSGTPLVITEVETAQRQTKQGLAAEVLTLNEVLTSLELISDSRPRQPLIPLSQAAYLLFTSGSTGKPKAVCVPHRGLANLAEWTRHHFEMTVSDRVGYTSGLGFDAGVFEIWSCFLAGATLVPIDDSIRSNPSAVRDWIDQARLTICFLPTPLAEAVLDLAQPLPERLRLLHVGGEALHRRPPSGARYRLMNDYGPTENTIITTACDVRPDGSGPITIGQPIDNVTVYVLDRFLQVVPPGVAGELLTGGDNLARGYVGWPRKTAEQFIPNPFSQRGERLYRTGDLALWLADGQIQCLGRLDQQIKISGRRIEPGEIKTRLEEHPMVQEAAVLALKQGRGSLLTAYVVPVETSHSGGLGTELVSEWHSVFDEKVYENTLKDQDPLFNISGWFSHYDDLLLPQNQMRAWADDIIFQILELKPRRVLEVGCGTGMLLFGIAPHCESYTGLDFSAQALAYVQRQIQKHGDCFKNVRLEQRTADAISGLEGEVYDVVILNSVAQYFPGGAYLNRVIQGALDLLQEGGFLFLGDLRNLALSKAFHSDIRLFRAADELPVGQLRQQINHAVLNENELLVDPAWLAALPREDSRIHSVRIRLQRGHEANELNRFRYHALVRRGQQVAGPPLPPRISGTDLTLDQIGQMLANSSADQLLLVELVNARLAHCCDMVKLLAGNEAPNEVGTLRTQLKPAPGMEPGGLWDLAARSDYDLELSYNPDSYYKMDALFYKGSLGQAATLPFNQKPLPIQRQTNNPLQARVSSDLIPVLKEYMEGCMPAHMRPGHYIVMEALPLTTRGKLNVPALPLPLANQESEAPETDTEKAMAVIFARVLGLDRVGRTDDFFDLGGHSLLTARLASGIREKFGVSLPLYKIFENPSVAALALAVGQQPKSASPALPDCVIALRDRLPGQTRAPIFFAPPAAGSPFCYVELVGKLGPDQPFYGFLSPGLVDLQPKLKDAKVLAALYVQGMRQVQPEGPYTIGGWSQGGIIAFEMACQLKKAGQEVNCLIMVDTAVGAMAQKIQLWNPLHLFGIIYSLTKFTLQIKPPRSYAELRALAQWVGISLPSSWKEIRKRPLRGKMKIIGEILAQARHSVSVFNCNFTAVKDYDAEPFPGHILLLRSHEQEHNLKDPMISGLARFSQELSTSYVPGNHMSMMMTPAYLEIMAKAINEHLSRNRA